MGYAEPAAARSRRASLPPSSTGARRRGRWCSTCGRRRTYAAGHIPGAIHLDLWGLSLTDTDPAPLNAFMWMIEHVLAIHGVTASTPVVVYDEQSGVRAARAFWFLEYFGHPSVRVLDGGFGAWTRAALPVTRDAGPPPTSEWTGGARGAHASRRGATCATRSVAAGCRDPRHAQRRRVLRHDRPRQARRRDPGRRPHRVDAQPRRPTATSSRPPSCEKMYEDAGVTPDREVITYCQGGYRAAHSYLALRLLGYPRVRNYVGSWKEWGDREELPIEVPGQLMTAEP